MYIVIAIANSAETPIEVVLVDIVGDAVVRTTAKVAVPDTHETALVVSGLLGPCR